MLSPGRFATPTGTRRAAPLPPWASTLGWIVVGAVYVPAIGLAAWRVVIWARRLAHRERPWQEPLDLVALAFWLTVAAQLLTWFGTSGIMRYSLTFFGPLPLLVAAVLARLARRGRAGRVTAVALAGALIAFNVVTHVAFVRAGAGEPVRPVDAAIAQLEALGVTACYADSRIAQVITFESDRAGSSVPTSTGCGTSTSSGRSTGWTTRPAVAIVTHRAMDGPARRGDERGASPDRREALTVARVGDYVIFHHFVPPDPRSRPVPSTGWRARASSAAEDAALAFDRRAWTRWEAPKRPGEWIELDLGQIRPITQVSLLSAPWTADAPPGSASRPPRTASAGRRWRTSSDLLAGLHWWKGHPRLDDSGRIVVRFAPRQSRYVRLTNIGAERPGGRWSLAEVFVYETAAVSLVTAAGGGGGAEGGDRASSTTGWTTRPDRIRCAPRPPREHRRAQVRWGCGLRRSERGAGGGAGVGGGARTSTRSTLAWAGWGRRTRSGSSTGRGATAPGWRWPA